MLQAVTGLATNLECTVSDDDGEGGEVGRDGDWTMRYRYIIYIMVNTFFCFFLPCLWTPPSSSPTTTTQMSSSELHGWPNLQPPAMISCRIPVISLTSTMTCFLDIVPSRMPTRLSRMNIPSFVAPTPVFLPSTRNMLMTPSPLVSSPGATLSA